MTTMEHSGAVAVAREASYGGGAQSHSLVRKTGTEGQFYLRDWGKRERSPEPAK